MRPNEVLSLFYYLIAIVAGVLVLSVVFKLDAFFSDLRRINLEIKRSSGGEKKYWIRKKRKLWRMLIPFTKLRIKKKKKK